ncbi:MAG: radical SAM protein [Elusimicrobia bacterium]|nr:radical SAM protein [Elusimicrobiota bacterium]
MKKPFRRAFIEITNACNLSCVFCAASSRPAAVMPIKTFENAAKQAGELAEVISLHVLGEPLTHPEFPAILACCTRLGLKLNLVTNGTMLENFPPAVFAEKCLSQISISLQALSCLPAAGRETEIGRLARFALSKPPGLTIGFRLRSGGEETFFRETLKSLLAAFARGGRPEADFVKLGEGIFLNFGGIFGWPRPFGPNVKNPKGRGWPGGEGGKAKHGCLGLRHHFGILSDCRVVPCCADFDGRLAIGNINDNTLAHILGSAEALALRKSIAGITPMPAYCSSCGFTAPDS